MLLPVRNFLFAACTSSILVSAQPATAQSADDKATGRNMSSFRVIRFPVVRFLALTSIGKWWRFWSIFGAT